MRFSHRSLLRSSIVLSLIAFSAAAVADNASPPIYTDAQAQAANTAAIAIAQASAVAAATAAAPVQSVNGQTGAIITATLPGTYTVQSSTTPLPAASSNTGRYARVSDLAGVTASGGGGTGLVLSNGTCWSRFRNSVTPQSVALSTTVTVTALSMSSLIQLSGASIASATTVNFTGACQGDVFRVMFPSGLLSALGSLGITVNGSASLPVSGLAGATSPSWADYTLNGTTVLKIAGGSL